MSRFILVEDRDFFIFYFLHDQSKATPVTRAHFSSGLLFSEKKEREIKCELTSQ